MQLSAPANIMGSATAGRITAHFVKPSAKTSATPSSDDQENGDGISFGAAFKTDPNAPYDVVSDKLDVDDNAKAAIFTGNVSAIQGGVTLRSQEMTAFYTGNAGIGATAMPRLPALRPPSHISPRRKGRRHRQGRPDRDRRLGPRWTLRKI